MGLHRDRQADANRLFAWFRLQVLGFMGFRVQSLDGFRLHGVQGFTGFRLYGVQGFKGFRLYGI